MNPLLKFFVGDYSEIGLHNKSSREKWLKKTLAEVPANQTILDAGAGELKYKSYCEHLKYVSQDFAQYDGKGDGIGIQTSSWDNSKIDLVSDIASIPVDDASFDNILCSEVFEHIPHPVEALSEFSRILKPGGRLILTAPFCSLTHFAPYHFYTGFNSYFYKKWMTDFNFEIIEMTENGNYYEYLSQEVLYSNEVAQNYSKLKMGIKEKIAQRILLTFYKKASSQDSGSKEILSFGFHIVAIKK
jgi:ubiquinone/menaquinone biosynthesis C-methylase UbiE